MKKFGYEAEIVEIGTRKVALSVPVRSKQSIQESLNIPTRSGLFLQVERIGRLVWWSKFFDVAYAAALYSWKPLIVAQRSKAV